MRKVILHIRADAKSKPGGDFSLLKSYAAFFSNLGFNSEIVFSHNPDLTDTVLGFTINSDRPVEPLLFAEHCRKNGVPVFLYSLAHPKIGVDDYLRYGARGFRKIFSRLSFFDSDRYESIIAIVKWLRNPLITGFKGGIYSLSRDRSRRRLLEIVDKVLCSGETEKIVMQRFLSYNSRKIRVLPHFFGSIDLSLLGRERKWDVVCAGRFESRKNQLLVADLAKNFSNVRFLFVGDVSPTDRKYGEKVISELINLDNVEIKGHLTLGELRSCFAASRIFVSASWFEVISLTELEAFSSGCTLVVSENSYLSDYVKCGIFRFNPASRSDFFEKFEVALNTLNTQQSLDERSKAVSSAPFSLMTDSSIKATLISLMNGV